MPDIIPTIACNLDTDILSASLPLFQESRVGAIEWSFDTLYGMNQVPSWFTELLTAFSNEGKLIGHGVYFSIFSGKWSSEHENWLSELKNLSSKFQFDHITEHFGFMTGASFHHGAPLSIPHSKIALDIGRDRLLRIYDACKCPVGLENLAFSYTLDEVKKHGEFLEELISPVNGFIILDLHNLYCQMHNFSIDFEDIIKLYPLDRVRELHISGGSWEDSLLTGMRVRRDTHDNAVPQEVFDMLVQTLGKCPGLKYVVLEQLGDALRDNTSKTAFRNDFLKMEKIIHKANKTQIRAPSNSFLPSSKLSPGIIIEDENLHTQQMELSVILENSSSYQDAIDKLSSSSLADSDWKIENWQPYMLETALNIAQKWR